MRLEIPALIVAFVALGSSSCTGHQAVGAMNTNQLTARAVARAPTNAVALDARWRYLMHAGETSRATQIGIRLFAQVAHHQHSRKLFRQLRGSVTPTSRQTDQLCTSETFARWLDAVAENADPLFLSWIQKPCGVPASSIYRLTTRWIELTMLHNRALAGKGLRWLHEHLPRADPLRVRYAELLQANDQPEAACAEAAALKILRPYDHQVQGLLRRCTP